MGTDNTNRKNKRPVKPSWQRALEEVLERVREEVDRMIAPPRRIPVPIPIPIPGRRYRRY